MSLMFTASGPAPVGLAIDDVVLKYDWSAKMLSANFERVSIQSAPIDGAFVRRLCVPNAVAKFVYPPYAPQYHESAKPCVADCAAPDDGVSPAAAAAASEITTRRDDRIRNTSKWRTFSGDLIGAPPTPGAHAVAGGTPPPGGPRGPP